MIAPSTSTLFNAGGSFSLYDRKTSYGILNTTVKDIYSKGRVDFTKNVTK